MGNIHIIYGPPLDAIADWYATSVSVVNVVSVSAGLILRRNAEQSTQGDITESK